MDRTQSSSENIFFKWESLFNAGSFLVVGATFTGTHLISWLKPPISKEGILVTSLLNGCAVLLAEKSGKEDFYYKTGFTLICLAASTLAAPYVIAFVTTATETSFYSVCQIGFSNLCIKTATYVCYKLYKSIPASLQVAIPTTSEAVTKLSRGEYALFTERLRNPDKKEWNNLDLASQIAWNRHWNSNNQASLLLTKLTPQIEVNRDDFTLIKKVHREDTSEEFVKFLGHMNEIFLPSKLDGEKIKNIQLNQTNPKIDKIHAPQSLEKFDGILSWTITNSAISINVNPGEFWTAISNINNENIIKTIAHVLDNQIYHHINYVLEHEEKPYTISKIGVSVNNLTEKRKNCVITISEAIQTKNGSLVVAHATITFENKDSLERLNGTINCKCRVSPKRASVVLFSL